MTGLPRTMLFPTGRNVRQLLGLGRRGEPLVPARVLDHLAVYSIIGLGEDRFELALRLPEHPEHSPDDDLAAETLRSAPTRERSVLELAVLLLWLLALHGTDSPLRRQRVIDVLYGSRARPERHNEATKGWLAVLQRAFIDFNPPDAPGPAVGRPLLQLEGGLVRVEPEFASDLAGTTYETPLSTFCINPAGVEGSVSPNPEGNLPSRAIRARLRLAAVLAVAPRRRGERPRQAVDRELEELVVDGGGDPEPVKRRRHQAKWGLGLLDDLKPFLHELGVKLLTEIKDGLSVLRSLLSIRRADNDKPIEQDFPLERTSRGPP